ncbi:hypothetical protein CERSUDRAFT_134166, partial [Gelatoporia subvermispora B]
MSEETKEWYSFEGTVYPDDRHIIVSREVSTIMQFRHMDFKMEHCILKIALPQETETFNPMLKLHESSKVDVWMLDARGELSPRDSKTWKRAPDRRTRLTTLSFSGGENVTSQEFWCTSGEFTTVELACALTEQECEVDFWQNARVVPRAGVYIIQNS